MSAPKEILDLVERFNRNREEYQSGKYNETQLRQEFLNPFFKALGWDVTNEKGYSEAYKEVIHEDAIKIGAATKAPDYCFRIGGTRKFFVEAKKPSINIKDDFNPAFQLRRYAWSAKLPLSILTDFEEFAVYDCRIKPHKTDKPTTGRNLYFTFDQYSEKWEEIAAIFSQDAVLKGSFDKFADSGKGKKGTTTVDEAFLEEIEKWRKELAKNIAVKNSKLSVQELNYSVQKIIDRIIFLRICEDRGIEQYGKLLSLINGAKVYDRLTQVFQRADERYNSGLFHFQKEKDRPEQPDELTLDLKIDDKIFQDMIGGLYYPESPYEFSALPADILGQVYEQFLGKVIRLTEGHQAKVEDKPEVKKAGGVYYTPTYIVEYIVKNTVGKLCEGKTPKQVSKLRILDPACGSGSFLIGAYQYLLDWHRDWYVNDNPQNHQKELYQGPGGDWRLTTDTRKKILLNNIFGVDIDTQAVEVTKLSLLLKVLEGESDQTLKKQLEIFHQRALPDLGSNVKCGNSLIGPDYFSGQLLTDVNDMRRVNPFDWDAGFSEILNLGGFDCVIGNPPYGALLDNYEEEYLSNIYVTTGKDVDTYSLFIEKATRLIKSDGMISMIVPTGWYSSEKYHKLRQFIICETDPKVFVNLPYDVFKAWVDTSIFVLEKRKSSLQWPRKESGIVSIKTFPKRLKIRNIIEFEENIKEVDIKNWFEDGNDSFLTFVDNFETELMSKILKASKPLSEFADVQRGVTPFALTDKPTHKNSKPAFDGTVRRYKVAKGKNKFIRFDETLAEFKPERYFKGERILLRELISRQYRIQAVMVKKDFITNKSMQSILPIKSGPDLKYLLGIINSKLISWFFLNRSHVAQRDDFPKIVLKETRSLPIHETSFSDGIFVQRYKVLNGQVEELLFLNDKLLVAKSSEEKELFLRKIDLLESQINEIVFKIYELSEKEISLINCFFDSLLKKDTKLNIKRV